MNIGRNDPCPCGSGRKYKQCCMQKDVAAGREHMNQLSEQQQKLAQLAEPEPGGKPPLRLVQSTPDDELEEMMRSDDPLWHEFETTAPEGMLAFFKSSLLDKEGLDKDMSFEMLCAIRDNNGPEIFAEALEALRTQRPELYAADKQHYLDWEIGDALIASKQAILPELCVALIEVAAYDLDSFQESLKKLSYYGYTAPIAEIMVKALPDIGKQQELFDWRPDEFASHTIDMTLYKHYEQHSALHADDPALHADLSRFHNISLEQLPTILDLLTGRSERKWRLNDFVFRRASRNQPEEDDPAVQSLYYLLLSFVGSLWRKYQIPLSKAELARNALSFYILRRHAGDIQPADDEEDDMFGFALAPRRKKTRHRPQYHPINVLCPDRATADALIASMIGILSADFYSAAAFLELMPAWVGFLVEQQLLGADQATLALQDMYQLIELVQPMWENATGDPHIQANIEQAWSHI